MQEALDRYGEENVRLWRTSVLRALPAPCRSQHGAAAVLHARAAPRAVLARPAPRRAPAVLALLQREQPRDLAGARRFMPPVLVSG